MTRVRECLRHLLTVTVSPEPTFITESGSLRNESLKWAISLRVHIEAAATGGSTSTKDNSDHVLTAAGVNTGIACNTCVTLSCLVLTLGMDTVQHLCESVWC